MAELAPVKSVIKQVGSEVHVSIPLVGFPAGFELQPGDKVTVLCEKGRLVARMLVHVEDVSDPAASADAIESSPGVDFSVDTKAVVDVGGENDRLEAYIVENDSGKKRAVAVLPRPNQ